jgi:uncharacterized membrane protein
MSEQHSESDERTVRRFEAFSDIVIGFSLAQLGFSLALPARSGELFSNPAWLISFFYSFALICSMWWFHHRIFASVFLPRTLPILLNFFWLAIVVLCVFATQIMMRLPNDPEGWRFSFILFTLAYGVLALQYRLALVAPDASFSPETRAVAKRQSSFMILWTAAFAVAALMLIVVPWGQSAILAVWVPVIIAIAVNVALDRHYRRTLDAHP